MAPFAAHGKLGLANLASGVRDDRPGFDRSTRLGRNLAHLVNTVLQDLSAHGVGLRVLAGQGTTTAAGQPRVRHLRGAGRAGADPANAPLVGIEAARARGRTSGRKFALSTRRCSELCRELGIRPVTLYREIPLGNGILTIVQKCSNVGHERD